MQHCIPGSIINQLQEFGNVLHVSRLQSISYKTIGKASSIFKSISNDFRGSFKVQNSVEIGKGETESQGLSHIYSNIV